MIRSAIFAVSFARSQRGPQVKPFLRPPPQPICETLWLPEANMTAAVSRLSETVARELPEQGAESPHAKLATLTRLWEEAEETACLANLLGRAPYAAAVLAAAGIATAVLSSPKGPAQSIA